MRAGSPLLLFGELVLWRVLEDECVDLVAHVDIRHKAAAADTQQQGAVSNTQGGNRRNRQQHRGDVSQGERELPDHDRSLTHNAATARNTAGRPHASPPPGRPPPAIHGQFSCPCLPHSHSHAPAGLALEVDELLLDLDDSLGVATVIALDIPAGRVRPTTRSVRAALLDAHTHHPAALNRQPPAVAGPPPPPKCETNCLFRLRPIQRPLSASTPICAHPTAPSLKETCCYC